MRLTLSVYVTSEREEGRSVYSCRTLRGPAIVTRDPLLSVALTKLGNKLRKTINGWIEQGESSRFSAWLYDPETRAVTVKLVLSLRDRTLRWKLLVVCIPAFSRYVAFSPSVPDVAFELESPVDLEFRATEVYASWAQSQVNAGTEFLLEDIGKSGEMWIEPLEIEVETTVRVKKKTKNIFAALLGGGTASGSEELHKVGQCLDDLANDFQAAIGRAAIVDEVDRLLQRDDRQAVLLVGPPAVGKSTIIQACVQRRAARYHHRRDQKPQVWWLSPQRLISGMSYLGQWEQRWLAILRESVKRDHILYFDDLVGLFTAGRTRDSSLSAADVLRGFLAEHPLRILAETTAEQLAVLRRRDRALADRFHLIYVPSLTVDDALPIALQAAYDIEIRTQRFFHPETVPAVLRHQETFAPDQAFPGKAIEMCKTLAKHASQVVDRRDVLHLAGAQIGASLSLLLSRMGSQQDIQQALSQQLIGQPAAVEALSRTVIRYSQQLQPPDRPLGVMLLLGPTGVGKTEAAKALTRLLYVDESHLVRLDMNELTTAYAAEQLVGTFDQPDGRLTAAIRRQPNCVILLDEIEKAHPDVFDYLLQVLGEGRLTDARGRVADFRSAIILMTSNLGAAEQGSSLGFETSLERRQQIYLKAAQQFFRPEFFNRIDEVVAFRNLDPQDMEKIVAIQMDQVLSRDGIKRRDIFVNVDQAAIKHVIRRGYDSQLGARAVRRMLESEVTAPLGDCFAGMRIDSPALVTVTHRQQNPTLSCDVTLLSIADRKTRKRISDLSVLLERGQAIYEQLDTRLSEIEDELRELDRQITGQNHAASYYALREQMYRCTEIMKSARLGVTLRTVPRLAMNSVTPSAGRRDTSGAGARRQIRDWQAQDDLRAAVNEPRSDEAADAKSLAEQLIDNLTIAKLMVDAALAPRSWLVGLQSLTVGPTVAHSKQLSRLSPHHGALLPSQSKPQSVLQRIVSCLQYGWQYEVIACEAAEGFWMVSGVSLLGILRPLLGTYRIDMQQGANHLQVLRAIPVEWGSEPGEAVALANQGPSIVEGTVQTPPDQPFPVTVIRGDFSEEIVDYVTGASTPLWPHAWANREATFKHTMQWWLACLPVLDELLED